MRTSITVSVVADITKEQIEALRTADAALIAGMLAQTGDAKVAVVRTKAQPSTTALKLGLVSEKKAEPVAVAAA